MNQLREAWRLYNTDNRRDTYLALGLVTILVMSIWVRVKVQKRSR